MRESSRALASNAHGFKCFRERKKKSLALALTFDRKIKMRAPVSPEIKACGRFFVSPGARKIFFSAPGIFARSHRKCVPPASSA